MALTALELHQQYALSSGLRSIIVWDEFLLDESHVLKDKIKILLPDGEETTNSNKRAKERIREKLFENLWMQRKYNNRNLLTAIIYVIVTEEKDLELAKQSTVFTHHPVFRVRKCINDQGTGHGCCMIFVDEQARVYNNWEEYLKDNMLPAGVMIAPANGVYTFNDKDEVEVLCRLTPAAEKFSKLIRVTDTAATASSTVAAVPLIAAMAFPVTAAIITAASAVAVTTAAYSTARSVFHLRDRHNHSQSTSLADSEARNTWLNIASGIFGMGAAGATKVLKTASLAGREVTMANKLAVCGINCTSFVFSGTGMANSIHYLYMKLKDDDDINALDLLQLSSSLLVFTHSLNNLTIATQVATTSGNNKALRSNLTMQMREDMQRSVAAGASGQAGVNNLVEVIRPLNDIPIGNTISVWHSINQYLGTGEGLSRLATGVISTGLLGVNVSECDEEQLLHLILELGNTFYNHIRDFQSIVDLVRSMGLLFCERTVYLLLKMTKTFIDMNMEAIEGVLHSRLYSELVLYKIVVQCVKHYSDMSYEFLESKTGEILASVRQYFDSLDAISGLETRVKCKTCTGYYYVCPL